MKFLSGEQKKFYDENGYVVLDLLSEDEISEISADYDDIFKRKAGSNLEATWQGDWKKEDKKTEVQSIHGLQMHSAVFTKLLMHPKMLDACEDLMGTENILLHHTKAHTKPPGTGSPFPMHQDYHYFPFKNDSMIAVFISLDTADPSNGGLCVYPGSHKLGPQEDCSNVTSWHYLSQDKFPISKATPLTLKRGQVVVFSYMLIHGSYDNNSDRIRRMFLIQLMAADDTQLAKLHLSDCQRMVLRGKCVTTEADIKKRHVEFAALQKAAGM